MKNEQQTITPILGICQLFRGKFHRGAKGTKFLEAVLASIITLEGSIVCSDRSLSIHIPACGSATLYSGSTKLRLSLGIGLEHTHPHVPPTAKGTMGTRHIASMLRPPPQRSPKFGLRYWHGLEQLQQRQQMYLVSGRGLVLCLPDSGCATVGQFIWVVKGREKSQISWQSLLHNVKGSQINLFHL